MSASVGSRSSCTRWIPPIPTSITRTPAGTGSASIRSATTTPKPSSPRRTFPTPATSTVTLLQDRKVSAPREAISELEAGLARYPVDRYPVQHATAQFHLGVAFANAGEVERAEAALS